MYNLVIYADGEDLITEDLVSWYAGGAIYDITRYVDTKDLTVSRGKIYREINFKFEESDQILSDEYRQTNNEGYGDLQYQLVDEVTGERLDNLVGDVLDIEVLFENPINERLNDLTDGAINIQYQLYTDREIQPIAGNPFLFFAIRNTITSNPIGFNTETTYSSIPSAYMPSHSFSFTEPSFNLNFNSVINEYSYQVMSETLYKRYYEDYIKDIFSVKRRIYKLKGLLPLNLVNKLKLNDRLVIKNTRYIINKITSNIVNREDELELINDIYDAPLASDTLNSSVWRQSIQSFSGEASSSSNTYYGVTGKTVSKVDTGDGVTWVTLTTTVTDGSITEVYYDVDENLTGSSRSMQIKVTDDINNPTFFVSQAPKIITVDNNVITVDNNIITVDNG